MEASNLANRLMGKERRIGIERRQFAYTAYIPERRACLDRRSEFPLFLVEPEADRIEPLVAQHD